MISGIEKRKKSDLAEFKVYSGKVRRLTEKVYSTHKSLINPNDYPRTLAGVDLGCRRINIMTVKFGFENNIPIETMCEKENLRMLPWKENISRSRKYKGDVS